MRLAAIFASALAVFVFQCGGQVDEQCPSAPTDSCVQEGKACTFPTTLCGKPSTETCTCKGGSFQCAEPGVCVVETCSIDTHPGSSCTTKGLQCLSTQQSDCNDEPITCTCNGTTFECAIPDCPPTPICPPADQITPGDDCSLPSNEPCAGPDASECFCNSGTWQCAYAADAGGPVDAGGTD